MESFSKYFIKIIRKYFKLDSGIIILASIPENRTKLFFIEQLCQLPSAEIFTVTTSKFYNEHLFVTTG